MPELSIPLRLTLTKTLSTVFNRQLGAEVKVTSRMVVQNDPEFLLALVNSVDTNKEHKSHGRTLKKLRRQLIPLMQECEELDPPYDTAVGTIEVSEETFNLLEELLDKPSEGFKFVERFNDSKEDLKEFIRDHKDRIKEAKSEPKEEKEAKVKK